MPAKITPIRLKGFQGWNVSCLRLPPYLSALRGCSIPWSYASFTIRSLNSRTVIPLATMESIRGLQNYGRVESYCTQGRPEELWMCVHTQSQNCLTSGKTSLEHHMTLRIPEPIEHSYISSFPLVFAQRSKFIVQRQNCLTPGDRTSSQYDIPTFIDNLGAMNTWCMCVHV